MAKSELAGCKLILCSKLELAGCELVRCNKLELAGCELVYIMSSRSGEESSGMLGS